jgi:hypothetical protein
MGTQGAVASSKLWLPGQQIMGGAWAEEAFRSPPAEHTYLGVKEQTILFNLNLSMLKQS